MRAAIVVALLTLGACNSGVGTVPEKAAEANRVQTSGKVEVPLSEVPEVVLAVARAARPGFVPAGADAETREGRRYFDIEGRTAEGDEIEFDIMEEDGVWRVVETQRDIVFATAPAPVQAAARGADPALAPTRVIESVQADGLVIYEVYQGERKLEVRWNGRDADVLTREWAH